MGADEGDGASTAAGNGPFKKQLRQALRQRVGDKRKDTKWTFMLSEKRVNGGNRRQKDGKGGVQKGTCDHGR